MNHYWASVGRSVAADAGAAERKHCYDERYHVIGDDARRIVAMRCQLAFVLIRILVRPVTCFVLSRVWHFLATRAFIRPVLCLTISHVRHLIVL